MERFGEKLKALRESRGMSRLGLTQALGYTGTGYISELEAGNKKPSLDFVLKVARYFDVTTDELLKDEIEVDIRP